MEELLKANSNCVDCDSSEVEDVNMQLGVFLCSPCAIVHQKLLNMPPRKVSEGLSEEEINFLSCKGNQKANLLLLKNVMPWTVSLRSFNFQLVREWMIEAKYKKQIFSKETVKKRVMYDLAGSWYYLDEFTRENSTIRGPYHRQAIKKLLDEGKYLQKECLVWHPSLGNKWVVIEKALDIISPPPSLSDQALQEAFMRKLHLQSYPHPHLKGYMDMVYMGSSGKKWLVIMDKHLVVYTNAISGVVQSNINLEETSDIVLIEHSDKLAIKIEEPDEPYIFFSAKLDEVMEWYHALRCCRHLVLVLGPDFEPLEIDQSELHICNVKSSDEYVGEKLHEGSLKKEGQNWKSRKVRWFILRTNTLYYYKMRNEKVAKKYFRLLPTTTVDWQGEYKLSNHISLTNPNRVLHMWADSTYDKEVWVEKFIQAIENLKNSEAESTVYTW